MVFFISKFKGIKGLIKRDFNSGSASNPIFSVFCLLLKGSPLPERMADLVLAPS